jgi:hypothetical protein
MEMELPLRPTILQVKHELSHYLDYKKLGFEAYNALTRGERELLVLQRLQKNRIWDKLNDIEKKFAVDYVNQCFEAEKPKP